MGYLLLEVPGVTTEERYRLGEELNLYRRSHGGDQYFGKVIAVGRQAERSAGVREQQSGYTGEGSHGLPPIRTGGGDYVRRIVIDARASGLGKLRRLLPGSSIRLNNDEGYTVRAELIHAYDVKEPR
jgi:hypothetical protein